MARARSLADIAGNLRVQNTYAPPESRGVVPTGAAPYRMPTADVYSGPVAQPQDPLALPPAPDVTAQTPRPQRPQVQRPQRKQDDEAARMQRLSEAIVYSPTPAVDWRNSPPTLVPLAKLGISVRPDEQGNIPVAFDVAKLQPGDLEWIRQQQNRT